MQNPKYHDRLKIFQKKFHWRWLMLTLCCERDIMRFYEVENINDMGDVLLYTKITYSKFPQHLILIKRTSQKCYRVTSLVRDNMEYKSFSVVEDIITYLKKLMNKYPVIIPGINK